jgi:hypothetical protein
MGELLRVASFHRGLEFKMGADDFVFFSWPTHYSDVMKRVAPAVAMKKVIHIVQSTRHANPDWLDGYAYRLLSVHIARIMITEQVFEATRPLVNSSSPTRLIRQGHDWEYFQLDRIGGLRHPVRVAYTTWKSTIGDRVAAALANDDRFVFKAVREEADWESLRGLYHWSDVFLAFPRRQEGFYLPGLEALAAGSVLVTPDVGGNMAYCRFDSNSIQVEFGSPQDYVRALSALAAAEDAAIESMRQAAYSILPEFDLRREGEQFGALMAEIG